MSRQRPTAAELERVVAGVADPEIPTVTIGDLGMVRAVTVREDGAVEVVISPTYLGCPALETIRADVEAALRRHGAGEVAVRAELSPPWTTDWISADGRRVLADCGIAPPGPVAETGHVVRCPRCDSTHTQLVSRSGSTACQAQYRCLACLEPFPHFRAH